MTNVKAYIPLAAFLILPFGFLSTGLIHIGHYYALSILALVVCAAMIRKVFVSIFLSYIAIWQVILFLRVMGDPAALNHAANGYGQLLFFLMGAVVYIASARSDLDESIFFNVICIAVVLQCFIGILQWFKIDLVNLFVGLFVPTRSNMAPGTIVGSLGNPNFLAAFMAISIPFFFRKGWAWLLIIVVPIVLGSMTSSAVDPMFYGIYAFWFLRSDFDDPCKTFVRAIAGFVIATLCCVAYSSFVDASPINNPRFEFWAQAWKQMSASPWAFIFGFGQGANWGQKWPLHSEWITCFYQFGAVGVSLLIGYLLSVGRTVRHPALLASFVIIVLNWIGNSSLHYAPTGFLIAMIGGLLEREQHETGMA